MYELVVIGNFRTDGPSLVYYVWLAGTEGTQPFTHVKYVVVL